MKELAPKHSEQGVCPNCGGYHNRKDRRKNLRRNLQKMSTPLRRFDNSEHQFREVIIERNNYFKETNGKNWVNLIFSPQATYIRYLDTGMSFSLSLQGLKPGDIKPEVIERNKGVDIFSREIRGTNLWELASMDLEDGELQKNDISKISHVLRSNKITNFLTRTSPSQSIVQEIMMSFPVQAHALIDERTLPNQLQPLFERLTSYYDQLSSHLINPPTNSWDRTLFILNTPFSGGDYVNSLFFYTQARLGLSPSTVDRLNRLNIGLPENSSSWKKMMDKAGDHRFKGFLSHRLPAQFAHLQKPDLESEEQLASYYTDKFKEQHAQSTAEQNELFTRLDKYHNSLIKSIRKSGNGYIDIPFDQEKSQEIRRLILTSQYNQTLMVLAFIQDFETPLLLELNGDRRVYGLPPKLERRIPHADQLIAQDILTPVLENAAGRFSHLEPERRVINIREYKFSRPKKVEVGKYQVVSEIESELEDKVPKRKTISPIDRFKSFVQVKEPEVPDSSQYQENPFKLNYTRKQIADDLGVPINSQEVDRFIQACADFEAGKKHIKYLEGSREEGIKAYEMRVGDRRLVMTENAERDYDYSKILGRDKLNSTGKNRAFSRLLTRS